MKTDVVFIDEIEENKKPAFNVLFRSGVGPQGSSAYDVAKKQGFVGTEEEWIASLKGDKGDSPVITTTKVDGITTILSDGVPIGTINDGQRGHDPVITSSREGAITTIFVDGQSIAVINDGAKGDPGTDGRQTIFISDLNGVIYWKYAENDDRWKEVINVGTVVNREVREAIALLNTSVSIANKIGNVVTFL